MVDHGAAFGVDLYELETAAKEDLPTVSAVYGDAVANCDRIPPSLDAAMRRPEHFGGDPLGPVHKSYLALHHAAAGVLRKTKGNLDDTATALDKAVQLYAASDNAAKTELERRSKEDPPTPER